MYWTLVIKQSYTQQITWAGSIVDPAVAVLKIKLFQYGTVTLPEFRSDRLSLCFFISEVVEK